MSAKRYITVKEKTGEGFFGIDEAIKKLAASASAKFDETADMAARLGVDPKHPDQMVRGSVVMPNPKLGTVTFDIKKAVAELRAGKVEFKIDKSGIVHAPFGKASFGEEKLKANFTAIVEAIMKAKPSSSKGGYLT